MEKFYQTIQKAIKTTTEISNLLSDDELVCQYLNRVDKKELVKYTQLKSEGPVVMFRKEVAEYLISNQINKNTLNEIILKHRTEKPNQLRSWTNTYKIFHPLINT
jgi:hypothetical protein